MINVPIHFWQVLAVLICMSIIIGKLNIDWADVFEGYLPSKTIFASGGLYICKLPNIL